MSVDNIQNYKIIIAYEGTDFAGWQVQRNQSSVANVIENRFYDVFKKRIHLLAASRTDAGVHAYGQVASFTTDLDLDIQKLKRALQNSLPASIIIRSLEPALSDFNPRYHVLQKTYYYHFFLNQPLPWVQRFGYYHSLPLDLIEFERTLQMFVGTHDFRAFCTGNEMKSTVRTIESIHLDFNHDLGAHRIVFKGKSFLRYMIRRIVGTAFQVCHKKLNPDIVQQALMQKRSNQFFCKAPAHGLMLHEIIYHSSD
jgi:tRNA pseudouridine38-40 synthase